MSQNVVVARCVDLLTEPDWLRISLVLPPNLATRAKRKNEMYRGFVEAVLWVACNGAFWSELPKEYGTWRSVYVRYIRWCDAGTWTLVREALGAESVYGVALNSLLSQQMYSQQKRRLRAVRLTNRAG
ncbi:transposase [Lysobacter capsici]|uniref:transposase n=1 Tax=Lysobacter capsici TaxID=435897 RepID=UPI0009EA841D